MNRDLEPARTAVEPLVVEGELVWMQHHALCGEQHPIALGHMRCCCGEEHHIDGFICCGCGHHHNPDARCLPTGPCGSYLCCVN